MNLRLRRAICAAAVAAVAVAFAAPASAEDAAASTACVGRDLGEGPGFEQAKRARADDLLNAQGLLWRVERDGVAPSYLFGVIHSTDDGAVAVARQAAEFVASAKVVATELGGPVDAAGKGALANAMLAKALARDEDTFAPALTGADAAAVEARLAARGIPKEVAHHLRLWFLAAASALPSCETARAAEGRPEIDELIARAGKDRGLPVVALETAQEQIDALAAAPADVCAAMLAADARAPELEDDAYATMLRLYREKRPAEMLAVGDVMPELTPRERAAEDVFTRLLLVGRNEVMAARAEPFIAAGGAFIAVGALHLSGKTGLIERFRAAGYRVVDVW